MQDATRATLQKIAETGSAADNKVLADLRKRKLVTTTKVFTYTVEKGPKYARELPVEHTDLTADMLLDGSWQTATFKPYNFNALGAPQNAGALHPLMKVRAEFRNIFFNQGFVEMPTSRFVQLRQWTPIQDLLTCFPASSTRASGTSMPFSSLSSILPVICRTLSSFLTPHLPTLLAMTLWRSSR